MVSAAWLGSRRTALAASVAAHVLLIAVVVFGPLLQPLPLPALRRDTVRVYLSGPPPPPPPPLPRGADLAQKAREALRPTRSPTPAAFVSPAALEEPAQPGPESQPGVGSETGSERGVPEGMEGGVDGGVVGGVPGGVLGGVIGGTGSGPVPVFDYDEPARAIRITKPEYPPQGFVTKTQGTVMVEVLIDAGGRVVGTRVVESIPLLDAAAAECVRQWVFAPARRKGRAVPSTVVAAITFTIY